MSSKASGLKNLTTCDQFNCLNNYRWLKGGKCWLKDRRNFEPGSPITHKAPSTRSHLSTLPIQNMLQRRVLGRVLWLGSQVNHRAASNVAGSLTPKQGPQKCPDPGYQKHLVWSACGQNTQLQALFQARNFNIENLPTQLNGTHKFCTVSLETEKVWHSNLDCCWHFNTNFPW